MSNIFTHENISKHNTKNQTKGVGEYEFIDGYWAMNIRPYPFYQNHTDESGNKVSYALKEEFIPNTRYVFSIWINADYAISSEKYRQQGMRIYYDDNSSSTLFVTGPQGWVHKTLVTPEDKTVKLVNIYYGYSLDTYYRYDSFIIPLINNTSVEKNGIVKTGEFIETVPPASFGGDYIIGNEFIEY